MTFLKGTPDLSGWAYGLNDLTRAREYFVARLPDWSPGWIDNPLGTLAVDWNADGPSPACSLIDLARTLYLCEVSLTLKSVPLFRQKARELFTASGAQFEERLLEFQVAAMLAGRVSPISWEPLVPEGTLENQKPPSPDLGLLLPEGHVLVEVTIPRFEMFDRWDVAREELTRRISARVFREGAARSIELRVPVPFRLSDVSDGFIRRVCTQIARDPVGEIEFVVHGLPGAIRWHGPSDGFAVGPGVIAASAVESYPVLGDDAVDRLFDSFRHTLERKLLAGEVLLRLLSLSNQGIIGYR